MTVRNDCRIEWIYEPVVVSGTTVGQVKSAVSLDLCFGVGDCVLVKPWLIDDRDHYISSEWYRTFPKHPVMFLGLNGFVDDKVFRRLMMIGSDNPPIPFFDPLRGIIHLPLSAIDQVLTKDGPRRSQWVVREAAKPEML